MAEVAIVSRRRVGGSEDVVSLFKQAFTQVGTDESGTPGDEYSLHWHEIVLIKACKCTIFIWGSLSFLDQLCLYHANQYCWNKNYDETISLKFI